ncbi:hypothetical protein MWU59_05590 [Flavobacteriaceae bacterium F08102]|nr:hypothetical protein [Flavobacteriaceae bacterium F08102]
MKIVSLFLLALLVNPSLTEIRALYVNAANSSVAANTLFERLEEVKETGPAVLVGYKAAAITLQAKQQKGAKQKKEKFKEGVDLLEKVLMAHPNEIELRLIRLSIQENAPKLLKYHDEIEIDKQFISTHFSSQKSKALKDHIRGYVLQSDSFSSQEKALFSER